MYVQITTRCNMLCSHCAMNCTAKGQDMTFKTFKQIVDMGYDSSIFIGGGEPTIHSQFEKFLFYALANSEYVGMVTNGKITNRALALARIANKEDCLFTCDLSIDPFHEPIDQRVINAFEGNIRDTSHNLTNAGRCDFGVKGFCIYDGDPFIKPNGNVYQCGCVDSPKVGNVFEGFNSLHIDGEWICHKKCRKVA